ncbi:M-phase inducer phosphatase, partial [Stegodyphus mimosarum]
MSDTFSNPNSGQKLEEMSVDIVMSDMSPVTNLALNLRSLSTSVPRTPIRRISWSNPFPDEDKRGYFIGNLSPYIDSPTFQHLPMRAKNKAMVTEASCTLPSDIEDDKENMMPIPFQSHESMPKKSDEDVFENDSEDSGCCSMSQESTYSSMSQESNISSSRKYPLSTNSRTTVRSSIFTDDDDYSFGNIFEMDDDRELLPLPDDVSSLFMKPLYDNKKARNLTPAANRNGKLPIRRCLSIEMDDSPVHSTQIRSRASTFTASCTMNITPEPSKRCVFKRPDPPNSYFRYRKRRKSSHLEYFSNPEVNSDFIVQRSFSETAATIACAIQKADLQPELIGDCSRNYALPLVKGRHQDLKCITPETLVQVLKGDYNNEIQSYTLVDCRYPYEFDGGHIKGAKNIYTKEDILETFLKEPVVTTDKNIIIFHCEFSSERAPTLCRFLRNKDREMNEGSYPRLHHPEIYLLEGGYKAFFKTFSEYCEPQSYTPMNHKDHDYELRHFRAKSKSWGADCKGKAKLRSNSVHPVL